MNNVTIFSPGIKRDSYLDPVVLEYFSSKKGSFGCLNLLPSHLPSGNCTAALVKNIFTVDYAISKAFGVDEYSKYIELFCTRHVEFSPHYSLLKSLSGAALCSKLDSAISESMDTINIFSPKQCNLACAGCYTSAKSILSYPYSKIFIESYYLSVVSVINQAKGLGAKTVYTSGDGELTSFPLFFDLLDYISESGMQWLFFTAGLIFSSESAADIAWRDIKKFASVKIIKRIESQIKLNILNGKRKPIAMAFLNELNRYKDNIQVYHSVWSTSASKNTKFRNPLTGNYEYSQIKIKNGSLVLPSSVDDMLTYVFSGEDSSRFGIQMPVTSFNVSEVSNVAKYVSDRRIKSYFEPVISTGRNKSNALNAPLDQDLEFIAPLLVRESCSFRNVHQPTVKVKVLESGGAQLYVSPGMGIDLKDLSNAGVLDKLRVDKHPCGLLSAVHTPLMVYSNYTYSSGCKCNDFGLRLKNNKKKVHREWQVASNTMSKMVFNVDEVKERLTR